uniref:Uncharacterized protein n=1 Tax=Arundo donax TaxID=35708 RepID=A0A0A8ZNM3_ARUDO
MVAAAPTPGRCACGRSNLGGTWRRSTRAARPCASVAPNPWARRIGTSHSLDQS